MQRPRVILFSGTQDTGSGAERVLEYFLAGATEHSAAFHILAPEKSTVALLARELGYPTSSWSAQANSLQENSRAFLRVIQKYGRKAPGDVMHAWHTRGFEYALALGKYWRIPCSGTLHDDPSHRQFGFARRQIISAAAARLDGVGAVSAALVDRCKHLGWKNDISLLRNGLPEASFNFKNSPPLLQVGFLASGSRWKGTGLLPALISQTQHLPLEWNLYGEATKETAAILAELAAYSHVRLWGKRPADEIFARIDLLLHLSLEFDPFPTVLLEAARAGIPAIATRIGGTPEIIEDGVTGLLISPGNVSEAAQALQKLFTQAELRTKFAEAARTRFEKNFRVEQMIAAYQLFWNRLRSPRP